MKPPISYILPLLLLLLCIPHLSFASDDDQESTSYEAHLLSIEEYRTCLNGAASAEDSYGLYDVQAMSGEVFQTISAKDQQHHFIYSIVEGIDPQSPMLGLTELDAMRCCNWIETSLPSSDNTPPSTEVGSYILHEDGSFEVNDMAQLHLIHHDDGTFEIISSVKNNISPLMMWGERGTSDNDKKGIPSKFPDVGAQTAANRRQGDPRDGQTRMNITVPSLVNILHNDNFEDASLIGHTGSGAGNNGSYIAIQDHLWCLPEIIKACFRTEETQQQIQNARQKIRNDLEASMKLSTDYKEAAHTPFSRITITSGRVDKTKIANALGTFDQYFTDHNLTRGNLKYFCNAHDINVPEPRTGRIAKISEGRASSLYGSVDFGNLGTKALQGIQGGAKKLGQQIQDGLEYAEHSDNEVTEKTPLTAAAQAPQKTTVFNQNHIKEIHDLIATTRRQLSAGSTLVYTYALFDMKAAAREALTREAQQLLAQIRGTKNSSSEEYYNNWVYQSLDLRKKIISLGDAVNLVKANLEQTEAIAGRSEDLAGRAQNFAQMTSQQAQTAATKSKSF